MNPKRLAILKAVKAGYTHVVFLSEQTEINRNRVSGICSDLVASGELVRKAKGIYVQGPRFPKLEEKPTGIKGWLLSKLPAFGTD